ncbi:MAG: hypothetical protein A2622_12610 [Bdellovibrionales bacterium RIFCSPHIGHO2_01_FULL_40_29]|nr:MAG: hypothetical protein A2622_12610 [Bdellovibrionales bacterium RIFCSPHIGHO2_01_FULL_40_29]OFZ33464.1 MAG: hypothetical protein A3D17_14275 [Bdellovibrionales bacterium RIFCSPHIGHO2_02_FULL_40_15]
MKKLFLTPISFAILISLSAQAQDVTSCGNHRLVQNSEIIIASGDVMATKNGEAKAFSLGRYEVASVVCRSDFFDNNSNQIREMIAVRFKLSSTVPGSLIDPNGFNSGMMTMETEFENMSENKLIEMSRMEDEILTFDRLRNGNLVRKLEIPVSPAYEAGFQMISDRWTRDHIVPFSPYLLQGKIQNSKVREISCAIRNLKAKLNLSKAGESLDAIVELKNFKACQ